MKKLLLLIILYFFYCDLSYSQVTVILQQPPPYRFNIASLWNVTLINTTAGTYNLTLFGEARKSNNEFIVSAITKQFVLRPLETKVVNASDIQPITVDYGGGSAIKEIIRTTGSLPAGEFNICVYARDADSGNANVGFDCLTISVENFSQVELISPINESTVEDQYPVFTWLPPTPVSANQNLKYTLSIYEILSRQTAYSSVQSNPAFFELDKIVNTVYKYPAASRRFQSEKKYAARVKAYINNDLISESEIVEFTYEDRFNKVPEVLEITYKSSGGENDLNLRKKSILSLQEKEKPFKFTLSSAINYELANHPGIFSQLKTSYARIDVSPKISFHGIPFGINAFYATDQSSDRQSMNNISFNFDPNNLKDLLKEKVEEKINGIRDEIENKVKEKGEKFRENIESKYKDDIQSKMSFPLKLFSNFQNLGIGTNYPNYTDYTVSGVALTGVNIEYNPGIFYIALAGPMNNRAIENKTFERNVYSGRLGVGKKDDSHLFFTMMYAKDYENSITVDSNNQTLTPKSNYVFSTEGKLSLLKNKIKLEGEIGGSLFTDDLNAADVETDVVPQFVLDFFQPKVSSRVDYFYKGVVSFTNEKTNSEFKAGVLMVGPGYLSLGSPSKSNDKLEFQVSASQKLFNNQMTAKVSFKNGRDNLLTGYKTYTTKNSLININLSMRFKKYPTISINYYPVFLKNDAIDELAILDNVNQNMSIAASYHFKLRGINNNTSVIFSWNDAKTYKSFNNSYNWGLNIVNSMSFKIPLTITTGFGLQRFGITEQITRGTETIRLMNPSDTYTLDINCGYTFFEVLQNSIGLNFTSTPNLNRNISAYISYVAKFLKYFNIDTRLENTIYDDYKDTTFNHEDIIFKAILTMDLN